MSTSQNQVNGQSDIDAWCHIRETVNMLCLAVCQIEATLKDSNNSVTTLMDSFTTLASHTKEVSVKAGELKRPDEMEDFKTDIQETAEELETNINSSVEAFQFYDRVCQRLDHVSNSLEHVSEILASEKRISKPDEWVKIQDLIKSSYTMEAERIMFEFIMRGGTVKEALEIYQHHFTIGSSGIDEDNDEIELF